MEQYWEARNSLPSDTLLMFRLGDFYEMFYNDAVEGAKILGITLTKRQDYHTTPWTNTCQNFWLRGKK